MLDLSKFKHQSWLNGRIVVINDDCQKVMAEIGNKEISLVLTDPPYRNQSENQPTKDMRANGSMQFFGDKPSNKCLEEIFRISKGQIIWGANNFEQLPPYKGFLVWKKLTIGENFTMSMAEIAFLSDNLGTVSKIFEHIPQDKERFHPTQKPVALISWCLNNYSQENDLIFDGFLGSGTTAISCIRLKRRLIGCELDPIYFEKMCERIETELKQGVLF